MNTLVCTQCVTEKRLDNFPKSTRNKNGRRQPCKTCSNAYMKALHRQRRARPRPSVPLPDMVLCRDCGTLQPAGAFYRAMEMRLGLAQPCKACIAARRQGPEREAILQRERANYARERVKIRARKRAWHAANPAKAHAKSARWYAANTEKARVLNKTYRVEYAAEIAAQRKVQRCVNALAIRIRRQALRLANLAQARARERLRNRAYRQAHPENMHKLDSRHHAKRRALLANAPRIENVDLDVVYRRDRGICQLCHQKIPRELASRDHVIPLSQGGEHTYRNTVLACLSCNASKRDQVVTQQMRLF